MKELWKSLLQNKIMTTRLLKSISNADGEYIWYIVQHFSFESKKLFWSICKCAQALSLQNILKTFSVECVLSGYLTADVDGSKPVKYASDF